MRDSAKRPNDPKIRPMECEKPPGNFVTMQLRCAIAVIEMRCSDWRQNMNVVPPIANDMPDHPAPREPRDPSVMSGLCKLVDVPQT